MKYSVPPADIYVEFILCCNSVSLYGGCRLWQPVQADSQPKSSGLVLGRRPLGAVLHSSNEPGELTQ